MGGTISTSTCLIYVKIYTPEVHTEYKPTVDTFNLPKYALRCYFVLTTAFLYHDDRFARNKGPRWIN